MKEMKFHLDDFDGDGRLELHASPAGDSLDGLLEGTGFFGTEEGVRLDLEIERVGTAIHIRGDVEGVVGFTCGKCVEDQTYEVGTDIEFVLMPREEWVDEYEGEEEIELQPEDMDISHYEGEEIDLEPLIREAILLELPPFPTCPEDQSEVCDARYEAYIGEKKLEEQEEAAVDLRWAPLRDVELKSE